MGEYSMLLYITFTTVIKIMLAAGVGVLISRHFTYRRTSEKGLSFITARILFPCLLFSSLCPRATWTAISTYYAAPVLCFLPMTIGYIFSEIIFRPFFHEHFRGLVYLGAVFQNGTTFPLSILATLKGISWFDGEASKAAQSYVFLYNILCIISLWGFGEPRVAACGEALRKFREQKKLDQIAAARERERNAEMQENSGELTENQSFDFPFPAPSRVVHLVPGADGLPTNTVTDVPATSASSDSGAEGRETGVATADESGQSPIPGKRRANVSEQRQWYRPPQDDDAPLRVKKPNSDPLADLTPEQLQEQRLNMKRELGALDFDGMGVFSLNDDDIGIDSNRTPEETHSRRAWRAAQRAFSNPAVTLSISAIVISLLPPLRWCAEAYVGKILIGGCAIVGTGAIPMQLLLLGSTVTSSEPDPLLSGENDKEEDDGNSGENSATGAKHVAYPFPDALPGETKLLDNVCSQQTLFVVSVIILRLVIVPGACFLAIHLFRRWGFMPDEKPFILAMLVATCAPSAINGSIICALHDYYGQAFSKMIFFMCTSAVPASAIWLFFYIIYLGGYH